ncbi:MAG: replicative DNA helicase, partial [Actinomycetota bacterium]
GHAGRARGHRVDDPVPPPNYGCSLMATIAPFPRAAGSGGRVPPHNLEAEESVLGSMLLSKVAVSDALETLEGPDDFYREAHVTIAAVVLDLSQQGEPVDAITVAEELRRRGQLEGVGGAPYLHTLVSSVPTAANAVYYARIVTELATLRRLIDASTQIAQEAYDVPENVEDMVNRAEQAIFGVAFRKVRQDFQPIRNLLAETMEHIESLASRDGEIHGIATGFHDLDAILGGLQPGNLVLVAARPAMGKSTFAMNVAQHCGQALNQPVVAFSLEMSWMEIVQRMIAAEARVHLKSIRDGRMNEAEWLRVSHAVGNLAEAPVYIDDTPSISIAEIRAKCRRLKARDGLGLVIVDYIQLMQNPTRRGDNRVQEVAEISRSLKMLAKELNVPVLAVSQLSRQPEQGTSKPRKPRLSDLRESGALEQDADVVMFVWREDMVDKESERKGEAEIIIGKHRNGPTGEVSLAFLGHYTKFENLARI